MMASHIFPSQQHSHTVITYIFTLASFTCGVGDSDGSNTFYNDR